MNKIQLTSEGFQKMEKELQELKESKRPVAVDRLQKARAMGDLSENSEYVAAKEELAFIEERIQEIEEVLKNIEVIENNTSNDKVSLGKEIVVETNGNRKTFKLVGDFEADPMNGKISATSPIGKALLDKIVGDSVEVSIPAGRSIYKIISIK